MKKINLKDLSYFVIGSLFLTLGIRIISISNLGLSFSDAIPIKLAEILKVPIAASSILLGIFTLCVESIVMKRKFPRFECLIVSFVLGLFVDLWVFIIPSILVEGLILNSLVFIVGVLVLSLGVALYLQPKYSPHPNDLLLVSVASAFKISILKSKIFIDAMFALIAILLSSQIGIGSIFNTICIGFFVNKMFRFFEKIYNKSQ